MSAQLQLTEQRKATAADWIFDVLLNDEWLALWQIRELIQSKHKAYVSDASISARVRDSFGKDHCAYPEWRIERDKSKQPWRYRLVRR